MDIAKSIQKAFQYYQTGNLNQAKLICTKILEEHPHNQEILYLLGIVHAQLAEYDLAIKHMEKVLQLSPNNADAHLALGGMFQQKGFIDESINLYRKSIDIDPHFGEAYENLGNIFRDRHQIDEAIKHYKKAMQLNPNAPEIYFNLGNIFKEKRMHELAVYYYRAALRYKSDYAEAYNNLGMIYHEQKRLDEAISYYHKALKFDPNLTNAQANLEDASDEKRQYDEVIRKYRNWFDVSIRIRSINVEMMINAVINKCYFKQFNVQFHPEVLHEQNFDSGLKRRIIENILSDNKEIDDVNRFFTDLDRLTTIKKYFGKNIPPENICYQKNTNVRACPFELLKWEADPD